MRSEKVELRSEKGTAYERHIEYDGDKVVRDEFLRDGKPLDYAVYLSVDDADKAYNECNRLNRSGKLNSEGELAKLVASWRAKSISVKGGRILYFLVDDDAKKADRGYSGVIGEYRVLERKDASKNGDGKKQGKPVEKSRPVPKAKPLHETPEAGIVSDGNDDIDYSDVPGEVPDEGIDIGFDPNSVRKK